MKINYTLTARTYPVLIVCAPILIIGSYYSISFNLYNQIFISFGVFGALSFLFTQIGRDFGKKKEPKLWESWGGMPTIQILRFSNDHLDNITKQRYHLRLNELCPVEQVPTYETELLNSNEANNIYSTWTKFMISNTRDTNKFRLLYKENVNYGFRRNLWGLKPIAITILIVGSFILISHSIFRYGIKDLINWPNEFYWAISLIFLMLLFWIFVVTKGWIKSVAFAYAERLFELTEKINVL